MVDCPNPFFKGEWKDSLPGELLDSLYIEKWSQGCKSFNGNKRAVETYNLWKRMEGNRVIKIAEFLNDTVVCPEDNTWGEPCRPIVRGAIEEDGKLFRQWGKSRLHLTPLQDKSVVEQARMTLVWFFNYFPEAFE